MTDFSAGSPRPRMPTHSSVPIGADTPKLNVRKTPRSTPHIIHSGDGHAFLDHAGETPDPEQQEVTQNYPCPRIPTPSRVVGAAVAYATLVRHRSARALTVLCAMLF